MPDNLLYIPETNPVLFYDTARANINAYFTKHFEKWMFTERFLDWQQPEEFCQIWQTDDIVRLQFESNFDPIIVNLLDAEDNIVITTPALIGLPNKFLPGFFSFEVEISLADLPTGCYRFQILAGPEGDLQKTFISPCQYISSEQIRNSIRMEYWSSKPYHKDIIWLTGIKMQYRTLGHLGFLDKARSDLFSRDQKWNPGLIQSNSAKQFPFYVGDEFGIPDDHYNIVDNIWSCDNVLLDGKPFGIADSTKAEVIPVDDTMDYPKRGFKYTLEEGVNRNSRIFGITTDTTKKLMVQIMVDGKAFGDLSNQGSSNAVPVITEE